MNVSKKPNNNPSFLRFYTLTLSRAKRSTIGSALLGAYSWTVLSSLVKENIEALTGHIRTISNAVQAALIGLNREDNPFAQGEGEPYRIFKFYKICSKARETGKEVIVQEKEIPEAYKTLIETVIKNSVKETLEAFTLSKSERKEVKELSKI